MEELLKNSLIRWVKLFTLNITVDNAGNKKNITSFMQAEITLMVLNNVGCCPHLNLNQSVASGLPGTVNTNIENSAMYKSIAQNDLQRSKLTI